MVKPPAVPVLGKAGRGGRREGAGRKPNPESKRQQRKIARTTTRIAAAERALDGITPLDVMLAAMRDMYQAAMPDGRRKTPNRPLLKAAAELAAKAAPYVHPRLNSIESPIGKPLVLEHNAPKDMIESARIIAFALARGAQEHKKAKAQA